MVYLIHFNKPYRHARHYIGYTTKTINTAPSAPMSAFIARQNGKAGTDGQNDHRRENISPTS